MSAKYLSEIELERLLHLYDDVEEFWQEEEEEEGDDEGEGEGEDVTDPPAADNNAPAPDTEDIFDDEDDEPLGDKGKEALRRARNEAARFKKKLQEYKNIDLDEYQKVQDEKKKSEEQRLKDQNDWKKLSARQERSIKQKDVDIEKYQTQIQQLTKRSELKDYFYAAGGLQGKSAADGRTYYDHVNSVVDLRSRREKDGSYTVLGTDALEQNNDQGKPMTLPELFDELKADPFYGHYFKAETKTGGGMTPNGSNGKVDRTKGFEDLLSKTGYIGDPKGKTILNG